MLDKCNYLHVTDERRSKSKFVDCCTGVEESDLDTNLRKNNYNLLSENKVCVCVWYICVCMCVCEHCTASLHYVVLPPVKSLDLCLGVSSHAFHFFTVTFHCPTRCPSYILVIFHHALLQKTFHDKIRTHVLQKVSHFYVLIGYER